MCNHIRGNYNKLQKNPETFEMLWQASPPLFFIEDMNKYYLLHNHMDKCFNILNIIKYFYSLDSFYVNQKVDGYNKFPIHFLIGLE